MCERERESSNDYDINTFNVSKTFRDSRTRINENPILITEPRPALAAPSRRAASRMRISIEMDFQSLFILLPGHNFDEFNLYYKYHGHTAKEKRIVFAIPIFSRLLSEQGFILAYLCL